MITPNESPPTLVARWDPRWKLAAMLLAVTLTATVSRVETAATAFVLAVLLAIIGRVANRQWMTRCLLTLIALLPLVIVLPFTSKPDSGALILVITLKALAIVTLSHVLVATAPLHRTLAAARSLGVPGPLVQIALLATRYTHVLAAEARQLRIGWRLRGFTLQTNRRTYTTLANGVGSILVRSADRAERVRDAMRARGFDGTFHDTTPPRTAVLDVLLFVLIVIAFAAVVAGDRLL